METWLLRLNKISSISLRTIFIRYNFMIWLNFSITIFIMKKTSCDICLAASSNAYVCVPTAAAAFFHDAKWASCVFPCYGAASSCGQFIFFRQEDVVSQLKSHIALVSSSWISFNGAKSYRHVSATGISVADLYKSIFCRCICLQQVHH